MLHLRAHKPCVAVVAGPVGDEHRSRIPGPEGLETVQLAVERRRDVREEQLAVDIDLRNEYLRVDMCLDIVVEAFGEGLDILGAHRKARGIHVAAEVLQKVGARLHGLVEVEARNRARRTRNETVAHREHHRRTVVGLDKARGHDTHDTLHPLRVVDDGTLERLHLGMRLDVVVRLLRHTAVDVLAILIVGIDYAAELLSLFVITLDKQVHRRMAARGGRILVVLVHTHTPCGIDARPDLEDDVVDGDVVLVQTADLDYRVQSRRGHTVQPLEPVIGQNTVFSRQRDDVGGDAHHQQVEQMLDFGKRDAVLHGIGLHQLETYAAARQLVERIVAVGPLGVEHRHRRRNLVGRQVVVADNEINTLFLCIDNLLHGLDTAIEGYCQRHALARGEVDTPDRYAVAVVVTVGDVENKVLVTYLAKKLVYQRYGRGAVHVVVAIDHDLLIVGHGALDALHRLVHILYQERIVQIGELRVEKLIRLFYGVYASLYK